MSRKFLTRVPFIVPAGEKVTKTAHGSKVFIEDATAPFDLELDDGEKNTVQAGAESPDLEKFSKLHIYNRSTTASLRGTIVTGASGLRFNYPRTLPTRPVARNIIFTADPLFGYLPGIATEAVAYTTAGIPAGARRRQIVVSNRLGNNPVTIKVSLTGGLSGVQVKVLAAGDDYTLETDADFIITGTLGETCDGVELFYL